MPFFAEPIASPYTIWIDYCKSRGLTPETLAPMKGEVMSIEQAAKHIGVGISQFRKAGAVGAFVFALAPGILQARLLYDPDQSNVIPLPGTTLAKPTKYYNIKNAPNVLYVPPHITDWFTETKYNLLIVEGALNAVRLAAQGYHAVSITGVPSYHTGGKHTPIIPELVEFARSNQAERITILFDSDTGDQERKRELWNGIHNLAQDLMKLRAQRRDSIYICRPPVKINGDKRGPDDYLNEVGIDEFNKLLREKSERYDDNPYLRIERKALDRFIFDQTTGTFYDCDQRISVKTEHAENIMRTFGMVDDILANRPSRITYDTKRLLAAPDVRIAEGLQYQPDVDEMYFKDESIEPPAYKINKFQPIDLPKAIKGDVSIVYEVLNSLCRDDTTAVGKILTVIAYHVQFPASTPKYALLFTGEQRAGKTNFAKLTGLAMTKKYASFRVNLKVDFNSTWRGRPCWEWAEFDKIMDEEWLKDLITGDSYEVNTKYGTNYRERNYTLNIFTCNGLQSKIQEGDSRFVVGGYARADNKALGLKFEQWVNSTGPNHFRYHLLNEIDTSGYDTLDTWTKAKAAVIEASKGYKATVKDYIMEELSTIPELECLPNNVLTILLEPHRVNVISFNKEFGQFFVKPGSEVVWINGVATRFRAFKNTEKWLKETRSELYKEQYELAMKLVNLNSKKY